MRIKTWTELDKKNSFHVGDTIGVGEYTATCQKITSGGAVFLLDQYLDRPMPMNSKNTNRGGYDDSDLRKWLQSDAALSDFEEIRPYMKPWNNGDLLRIPFYGELFGNDARYGFVEPDSNEQWPLMKDAHNRAASRREDPEWGWLANTVRDTSTHFCRVDCGGFAAAWIASSVLGVRPVFLMDLEKNCIDLRSENRERMKTWAMWRRRKVSRLITRVQSTVCKPDPVKTVSEIIDDVKPQICDQYCKYADGVTGDDYDQLLEKRCSGCPLNRL